MKKYSIGLCLIALCASMNLKSDPYDQVDDAIAAVDSDRVKRSLEKLDRKLRRDKVSPEKKKKIYDDLVESASDKIEDIKDRMGIFNSKTDVARLFGGLFLLPSPLYGALASIIFMNPYNTRQENVQKVGIGAGVGFLFSLLGGKFVWDGYNCKSQMNRLKEAQGIERLLEEFDESENDSDDDW